MCLPKCGRPDGPKCYRIPRKLKPELLISCPEQAFNFHGSRYSTFASDSTNETDQPIQTADSIHEIVDSLLVSDKHLLARREKSRVAAKLRRQKENQALVKLRLSLPILACLPTIPEKEWLRSTATPFAPDELHTVVSYRAANSISRQQQQQQQGSQKQPHSVTAPEFEKAVTVRLTGSTLCLYNWLYPNVLSDHVSSSATVQFDPGMVWLNLLSQSIVMVIVDTVENIIVYASPSYCHLIGLSWHTTIGLHLFELRLRQSTPPTPTNPVVSSSKGVRQSRPLLSTRSGSTGSHSPSDSLSDSSLQHASELPPLFRTQPAPSVSASPSVSRSRCTTQDEGHREEHWPILCGPVNYLTTLLPPESTGLTNLDVGRSTTWDPAHTMKNSVDKSDIFAISWGSQVLPAHSPTGTSAKSNPWIEQGARGSLANDRLRAFLFNPVVLFPSASDNTRNSTESGSGYNSNEAYSTKPPDKPGFRQPVASDGFRANWMNSPKSFHLVHNWRFAGAHPRFLSALGWTQSDLAHSSLLDIIHPDDLISVIDCLGSVTESQPVLTKPHRVLTADGPYRWSRILAFLDDQPPNGLWPELNNVEAYVPRGCAEYSKSSILVCCHQFVHLSTEPECSMAIDKPLSLHTVAHHQTQPWTPTIQLSPLPSRAMTMFHSDCRPGEEEYSNSLASPTPDRLITRTQSFKSLSNNHNGKESAAFAWSPPPSSNLSYGPNSIFASDTYRKKSYPGNFVFESSSHPSPWSTHCPGGLQTSNSLSALTHPAEPSGSGFVPYQNRNWTHQVKPEWDPTSAGKSHSFLHSEHQQPYSIPDPEWIPSFPRCTSTDTGISMHISGCSDWSDMHSHNSEPDSTLDSAFVPLLPSAVAAAPRYPGPSAFVRHTHPTSVPYLPQAEILHVCNNGANSCLDSDWMNHNTGGSVYNDGSTVYHSRSCLPTTTHAFNRSDAPSSSICCSPSTERYHHRSQESQSSSCLFPSAFLVDSTFIH